MVRKTKTKRPIPELPAKPKKGLTPYTRFLKDFFSKNEASKFRDNRDRFAAAARAWRALSPKDKKRLEDACAADQAQYDRDITIWKRQKEALKIPGSPYAFFVKDMYEKERGSGKTVPEVGKMAGKKWAGMSESKKDCYRIKFDKAAEAHRLLIQLMACGAIRFDPVGTLVDDRTHTPLLLSQPQPRDRGEKRLASSSSPIPAKRDKEEEVDEDDEEDDEDFESEEEDENDEYEDDEEEEYED